ncbi:hypothetical protein CYLTODRAFT_456819 [Cylindrobasidium torrendii FP15055 ss-10]|uniref:Uncharacterized protein n=1 Tax=Cylindrobasidium torrendii FP15055 ss-10 TaxID=1314674 RepID=A0A0D7B2N9_9AGAR|nr:hypothetical protein CYLTODRAFT_456819 [Cylindrobasidium torrendii FP15055 ss-10]
MASNVLPGWLTQIFTTNDAPSPGQHQEILNALYPLRIQATELEDAIRTLSALRDTTCNTVRLMESAIHPIRLLPDDILREIFEHCVPWCREDGTARDTFPNEPFSAAYYNIFNVCRNWRAVAHAHPRLWTVLVIGPRFHRDQSYTSTMNRIQHTVEITHARAGSLPIRVHIPQSEKTIVGRELLLMVQTYGKQWGCMRIEGTTEEYDVLVILLNESSLPSLHELSLVGLSSGLSETLHIPALRHLRFEGAVQKTRNLFTPLSQITRCEFINSSPDSLAQMVNLEELIISCGRVSKNWRKPREPPLVLPNLTFLRVTEIDGGRSTIIVPLFNHFRLPALRTLYVHLPDTWRGSLIALDPSLIPDSIASLSIASDSIDGENAIRVTDFIRRSKHLHSLHVGGSQAPAILEMLATDLAVLSRLRNLYITPFDPISLHDTAHSLKAFTSARMLAGYAPLGPLRVYMRALNRQDDQAALAIQCVGGQELQVVDGKFDTFDNVPHI